MADFSITASFRGTVAESLIMSVLLFACFTSHWWMMFFARDRLGREPDDASFDRLYNKFTSFVGFSAGFVWLLFCFLRTTALVWDRWPVLVPDFPKVAIFLYFIDYTPIEPTLPLFLLGSALYWFGFWLRLRAVRIMGRLFTYEIGIRQDHNLIEEGPYRWIRHPSYSGYLLMACGMGILFCSIALFLSVVLPVIAFFLLRIPAEEQMLADHFGDKYREYQERTWRLIPYII